jgi:hypothetical protein
LPSPMPTAIVTRTPRPTRTPTLEPTVTPIPTLARATVSASVRIDSEPSPTKRATVADFPTQAPIVTQIPTPPPTSASDFLSWVPALLGIVLVGLALMLFGPQLKGLFSRPTARVVPPPTAPLAARPSQPASALQPRPPTQQTQASVPPAGQAKVHFGTPVDFKVSSKEVPKT